MKAARRAVGDAFFINARTDIFLKAKPDAHDAAAADAAIERAIAYADAGASGYFIPGLANLELVERITKASPIPVNAMWLPGGPTNSAMGRRGDRADQPRAVPADGTDGDVRGDGARGARLAAPQGHEAHRDAVHAVALAGRRRAVVEDMAEMATAAAANDLGLGAEPAAVGPGGNAARGAGG